MNEKPCSKCGMPKPLSEFGKDKSKPDGLRPDCKTCRSEYAAKKYVENPEYFQNYREENRDILRQRSNEQYHKNTEWYQEYRDTNREYYRQKAIQWAKDNPVKVRNSAHKRRALKRNSTGTHTAQDILDLYNEQNGFCCYCGVELNDTYHVDHVHPLSRGGSNGRENLAIACPDCNRSKSDKLLSEWLV